MRTRDAVTTMPGLVVPFVTFTLLYVFLAAVVVWLLFRQVAASPRAAVEKSHTREEEEPVAVA
jgi:cytochrome d ubiquinol oxidase subunit I